METRNPTKKAKRVQSWYLYEQYKSLEKNQIDGAHVLRDRSCQEKILHKELEERRARRQFCNQLGSCQSESRIQSYMGSDLTSVSTDDFIDSICGFRESNDTIINSEQTYDLAYERTKYHDNKAAVTYEETSNTLEKEIETNSDLTTELQVVKQNIEESVHMQLEAMKENIQCLEKYAKQSFADKTEEPMVKSLKHCTIYKSAEYDNSLLAIWSGLVSFAYQVMRLNRGNCYYDCSNQLLTAVLLCDILWKGVNKMLLGQFQYDPQHKQQTQTRIPLWKSISKLQAPYVTPIKFEYNEYESGNINYRKKDYSPSHRSRGSPRSNTIKEQIKLTSTGRRTKRNGRIKTKDDSYTCNCLPSVETFSPRIRILHSSTTNRWLSDNNPPKRSCSQNCSCRRVKKVVNPMIKLSRYIDSMLKDLED